MVDITDAVETATTYLARIMPAYAALEPTVEEFNLSRDSSKWLITFRAKNPESSFENQGTSGIFFPYIEKVVEIDAEKGDLKAIRNPSFE